MNPFFQNLLEGRLFCTVPACSRFFFARSRSQKYLSGSRAVLRPEKQRFLAILFCKCMKTSLSLENNPNKEKSDGRTVVLLCHPREPESLALVFELRADTPAERKILMKRTFSFSTNGSSGRTNYTVSF